MSSYILPVRHADQAIHRGVREEALSKSLIVVHVLVFRKENVDAIPAGSVELIRLSFRGAPDPDDEIDPRAEDLVLLVIEADGPPAWALLDRVNSAG